MGKMMLYKIFGSELIRKTRRSSASMAAKLMLSVF